MKAPKVFISYSHKDEVWKDRLVTQLKVLGEQELLDIWDDRRIDSGDDWFPEIQKAMDSATVAILLVSADSLTSRFILHKEIPPLLERRAKDGLRFIPLIIRPCPWQEIPWLARIQARPTDGKPLTTMPDADAETALSDLAREVLHLVNRTGTDSATGAVVLDPDKISLAKLPTTNPELFGREDELALLDKAWKEAETNIVAFVAWGGVGKTALVDHWLKRMQKDHFRGAQRVYGWSFYSQGAREGAQVSADEFIAAALKWFGDEDPTKGSPWDKGERLAELVKQQRTLLILDGMEPLQTPPGKGVKGGEIKDPGLGCLLKGLAVDNPGLCVVSTRLEVDDLRGHSSPSVEHVDLDQLSDEAGAQLLDTLGVVGTDDELKEAAHDFGGHALALTLLGTYLKIVHNGEVRKRDLIPKLMDEQKQGAHARRVMESYEKWFDGKPELDILRIMGLFDRPAEAGAIERVKDEPVIKGLTSKLQELSDADWQYALNRLRQVKLLAPEDKDLPSRLDCHPLVREHFGEKLKEHNPKAWNEAHGRLFEYYKSVPKREFPKTIEEMAPLFAAVAHGCRAERYQEALDDVYFRRIQREDREFGRKMLGLTGAELAVLSGFFDSPWNNPVDVDELTGADKAYVLNEAGLNLRVLGRLQEAVQPTEASLNFYLAVKFWRSAARISGNLSELFLTLGDLEQSVEYAQQAVKHADRSQNWEMRTTNRGALADALHHAGRLQEAEAAFSEAEKIQKVHQSGFRFLYSIQGFNYCDLQLGQGKYRNVQRRARKTLKWVKQVGWLLDPALDHLSLGRACLLQAKQEKTDDFTQAATHLTEAVDGLRQAGMQEFVVRGLLARAELYRVTNEFDKAQKDLTEAMTIATRGGMKLHEADCHLEQARLHLAIGNKDEARQCRDIAKKMVIDMGYHRRDQEVADLDQKLS